MNVTKEELLEELYCYSLEHNKQEEAPRADELYNEMLELIKELSLKVWKFCLEEENIEKEDIEYIFEDYSDKISDKFSEATTICNQQGFNTGFELCKVLIK